MIVEQIICADAPPPAGHYSQAVRAGDFLFISGQVPRDRDGQYDPASVFVETQRVLQNVAAIAAEAGASLASAVKVSAYLVSIDDFAEFNRAYAEFFPGLPPARTTVAVGLRAVKVEVDAILYVGRLTTRSGAQES